MLGCAKGLPNDLGGQLCRLGTVGMPAHAVDNDYQGSAITVYHRHAILIFLAVTDQADFCTFNLQLSNLWWTSMP